MPDDSVCNPFMFVRQPDIHITDIFGNESSVFRSREFPGDSNPVAALDHKISLSAFLLVGINGVMAQIAEYFIHLTRESI